MFYLGKKSLLSILLLSIWFCAITQTRDENHEKYWRYRTRMKDNFVLISPYVEEFGTNITSGAFHFFNGDPYVYWGDQNAELNHNLSLLVTEYYLLKTNGADYSNTLAELVYALLAWERLDAYAEYHYRVYFDMPIEIDNPGNNPYFSNNDFNGFFLRDDVTDEFWKKHHDHFFDSDTIGKQYESKFEHGTSILDPVKPHDKLGLKAMSQDNMTHLMESFSLLYKLADKEDISDVEIIWGNKEVFPNGYSPIKSYLENKGILKSGDIDFKRWSEDIVMRMLGIMYHPDNPIDIDNVNAALQLFFISGKNVRWYIYNPVLHDFVQQGGGDDLTTEYIFSYGFIQAVNFLFGDDNTAEFKTRAEKYYNIFLNSPALAESVNYLCSILASVSGIGGMGFYNDILSYFAFTENENEDLPLLFEIFHGDEYTINKVSSEEYKTALNHYENLLNKAPYCGSRSYTTDDSNIWWQGGSRLVWEDHEDPIRPGVRGCAEYIGIDYLYLYNLYRIVFDPKLKAQGIKVPDYKVITTEVCNPTPYTEEMLQSRVLPGCLSYSTGITIEYQDDNPVKVYPNPTNQVFNIVLPLSANTVCITLMNTTGSRIFTKTTSSKEISIDMSSYPKGIYILNITSTDMHVSQKLVYQ